MYVIKNNRGLEQSHKIVLQEKLRWRFETIYLNDNNTMLSCFNNCIRSRTDLTSVVPLDIFTLEKRLATEITIDILLRTAANRQ